MADDNNQATNLGQVPTTVSDAGKKKKQLRLDSLPDLLTVREVAEILRVSPLTVKRWGKRGKLRVSPLTVKRWGKRGKLPAIRINSRGDRRYKKEAVLWLLGMQK